MARNHDANRNDIGRKVNPEIVPFAPTQPTEWRTQGFNPSDCDPIKAKKTSVTTLNTTYVVRDDETDQRTLLVKDNLLNTVETKLKACASQPEHAFVAHDAT